MIADSLAGLVRPLDGVRAACLRLGGRRFARWIRDRELRILIAGMLAIAFSSTAVLLAPLALAVFGPLLLGVPHVLSDARYLVVRSGLMRARAPFAVVASASFAAIFVGVRATAIGMVVLALVALAGGGRRARAALVLAAGVVLVPLVHADPETADVAFGHLHHPISLVVFVLLWPAAGRARWVVAALAVAVVLLFASGTADTLLRGGFASSALPIDPAKLHRSLAFGLEGDAAHRMAAVFLFGHSFHYALWLRLVPEAARARRGPRSFEASMRALSRDIGAPLVLAALLGSAGLLVFAGHSLVPARNAYLHVASFHGHLELLAATAIGLVAPSSRRSQRDTLAA